MPRGSASGKRQQGVSGNSTKHDNGLVAPGKRASRNRNHAHSDGKARSANLSTSSSTSTSAPSSSQSSLTLPSNGSANGSTTPPVAANGRTNGNAIHNGFAKLSPSDEMAVDNRHHLARQGSFGADSETSTSTDSFHSHHHHHHHHHHPTNASSSSNNHHYSNSASEPRQIDVNASKYAVDVHKDSGPLDFAATVLMALPLHDTLAILLILMHVSPLTLSVIYTVFTVLTFASPLTASSVVNIHLAELLDWHSTMPSLVTVLCVDILALLVFLFLWPSVQNAILDLAKPVIAATLGGGSTSRGGQSRTVSACFAFVISTHIFKNTRSHWARFLRLLPPSWRFTPDPDDPLEEVSRTAVSAVIRHPDPYFTLLGVHILMQGIVRYIREWYIRRERSSAAATANAGDPEAGKPAAAASESDAASIAGGGGGGIGVLHHALEAEPTPTTGGSSSTHSSTKRRRKQSAQVRLQQPLWAALASTKVVMVKEYELSHATSESACADATDIHNLGNAPFDRETGRIWISYVGCDEVSFDTSHFPDDFTESESMQPTYDPASSAAIDRSKPFYVRINNAHWPSARIVPAPDNTDEADDEAGGGGSYGTRWTGDIYGLRPMSKYVCEFVDTHTDEILFSTTVTTTREIRTTAAATAAAAAGVVNGGVLPNGGQRRPHSPATTLKTSIAASDAKLAAERAKLKTLRKEWKAKVNSLKKDNESTDHSINSAGGTDDRYRQKIRQQETQKAQADKEASELDGELKAFDDEPGDVVSRRKQVEKGWSAEKSVFETAQKEFKAYSSSVNSAVKGKEGDQQQLQTRRNKIANRVAKVDNELANIADANKRGLNEVERRRQERETWQKQVSAAEEKLNGDFNSVQMDNSMLQDEHATAMQQAHALYTQIYSSTNAPVYELAAATQVERHHSATLPSPTTQYPSMWNSTTSLPASSSTTSAATVGTATTATPQYPGLWPTSTDAAMAPISAPVPITVPVTNPATSHIPSVAPPLWPFPSGTVAASGMAASPATTAQGAKMRGRSSSMLSDISGFTQLSNEDQDATATAAAFRQGLKGGAAAYPWGRKPSVGAASGKSSGSGSGTGSWTSARDPSSP